jgi:UDP-N-acetylglucosamine 1-carboxyvinyltransferase
MAKFIIHGEALLRGSIKVAGAKNAALKAFPLVFLTEDPIRIYNMPDIEDCLRAQEILEFLGHKVKRIKNGVVELQQGNSQCVDLPAALMKKFRASIMFVGPFLARYGEAIFPHPGGCVLGAGLRPIDIFLEGFKKMGARVKIENDTYYIKAKRIKGAEIFFHTISVTATESLMMTACLAEGETVLKNCAMEPEIVALANFLKDMGAEIEGAGTPIIRIKGVKKLRGGEYYLMPDRIEAGTFAIMAAMMPKNDVLIEQCDPRHLEALWWRFDRIGVKYRLYKNSIRVFPSSVLKACDLITHEYPGFATDLQSPYTVLMTQAKGSSLIHETIYDRRLLFADMLSQMGAHIIMADPHRLVVHGPTKLYGRRLLSPDLRAGIALVLAGLIARGKTEIDNIYQIDRGYERIDKRLRALGAQIERVN